MKTALALDTSVAVPLLVRTHERHAEVAAWWAGRDVVLAGHAVAETFSVLTRLPGEARVSPADAATLIARRFGPPLLLAARSARHLPELLASHDIAGGAVYDAIVALAAAEHSATLATRDSRALSTYRAVGVSVEVVG